LGYRYHTGNTTSTGTGTTTTRDPWNSWVTGNSSSTKVV
jgi:hypothetical protein